jgi:sec-independent protein translocase protein TatC
MSQTQLPPPQEPETPPNFWEMIAPHVKELRMRLLWSLVGVAVGVIISFNLTNFFLDLLTVPIGGLDKLLSIEVTENLAVFMRVSLLAGFIIALPFVLYQLLAFITPGLHPRERRWLFLSIPFATLLFLAGVFFTYKVMLPTAIPFLISFLGVTTTPRLSNYIQFVTSLMFWVGVSFETPLVIFLLAKMHLVTAGALIRQWRIAIVVIAVLAAVITPTGDPVNMSILMAPLLALYLISILLAWFAGDRPPRQKKVRKPRKPFRIFKRRKKVVEVSNPVEVSETTDSTQPAVEPETESEPEQDHVD